MPTPALHWLTSRAASMFYSLASLTLYEALGSPGGPPLIASILANYFLSSSIGMWTLADARRRRDPVHYDFGGFVFFTWPFYLPIYLFKTRGWRAVIPLGCFLLLCLAAQLASALPSFLTAHWPSRCQ